MIDPKTFWASLDAKGEEEVRRLHAAGVYGERKRALVIAWLDRKDRDREHAARTAQVDRQSQALELSKEANDVAREANAISVDANQGASTSNRLALLALAVSTLGIVLSSIISVRGCQQSSVALDMARAEFLGARQAIWSGVVDSLGESLLISAGDPQIRLQKAYAEFPPAFRQDRLSIDHLASSCL